MDYCARCHGPHRAQGLCSPCTQEWISLYDHPTWGTRSEIRNGQERQSLWVQETAIVGMTRYREEA